MYNLPLELVEEILLYLDLDIYRWIPNKKDDSPLYKIRMFRNILTSNYFRTCQIRHIKNGYDVDISTFVPKKKITIKGSLYKPCITPSCWWSEYDNKKPLYVKHLSI